MIWRDHVTWARPIEAESMENVPPAPHPALSPRPGPATYSTHPPPDSHREPTWDAQASACRRTDSEPEAPPLPPLRHGFSPWLITAHGWTVTRAPATGLGPHHRRTPPRAPLPPRHRPAAAPGSRTPADQKANTVTFQRAGPGGGKCVRTGGRGPGKAWEQIR